MRRDVRVFGTITALGLALGGELLVEAQSGALTSSPATGATSASASSQPQQQVLPPEARYWMGATTGGGLLAMGAMASGKPSMATMMKMASGGLPSENRTVLLKLGSSLSPAKGEPEAVHTMPPGAQVNQPIALATPKPGGSSSRSVDGYTAPKGQISFYWGCGEKAGPGQPVVLSFDKLLRGDNDPELEALQGAVSGREVRKPSAANSKTYGDWPNDDRKNRSLEAAFRAGSGLAGLHVIRGTYSPTIEFTLPDDKSFMEAVRYTSTAVQASGAIALAWGASSRATGYSLGVMAPEKTTDDSAHLVMWSSANRPATFIQMEDLTPAEVQRLIALKAVLPPGTTSCAVPAEVVKATREGSMLMFTAFGDEATFVHPPRPADRTVTWDQEWFSRVSFKSVRMDMISPTGVTDPLAGATDATMSDDDYCKALAERQTQQSVAEAIPGGRLLRRFGRKKDEPPADPRCVKKP